jgi:hypothetical protein
MRLFREVTGSAGQEFISTRIPQLKLSEGQTWRSDDIGVFGFKVFFDAGSQPSFA